MNPQLVPPSVDELVRRLREGDVNTRGDAWQNAGPLGAPAVPKVAPLMNEAEPELVRSARRALLEIVRHAGRPGAEPDARAVEARLIEALPKLTGAQARRDLLWMLSEIGAAPSIKLLSGLLTDPDLREDARCALMRIPGDESLTVLTTAHAAANGDFKDALAEALSHRGRAVPGWQSRKLKPTKSTAVGTGPV